MSCEDLCTGDAGLYTCGQGLGPCSLPYVRATTTRCYGPSVISVENTKTRPRRASGLYRTSGAIGRGVAESRRSRGGT